MENLLEIFITYLKNKEYESLNSILDESIQIKLPNQGKVYNVIEYSEMWKKKEVNEIKLDRMSEYQRNVDDKVINYGFSIISLKEKECNEKIVSFYTFSEDKTKMIELEEFWFRTF